MSRPVVIGGQLPGTVRWLDDCHAVVTCDGHSDPVAVYEAACHLGADLSHVEAVEIVSGPDVGAWFVGPEEEVAS